MAVEVLKETAMPDRLASTRKPVVRLATSLLTPIHARNQKTGQFCVLIGLGEVEGMSPAYLFVDGSGRSEWAPITQFTIIDPHYLPSEIDAVSMPARR